MLLASDPWLRIRYQGIRNCLQNLYDFQTTDFLETSQKPTELLSKPYTLNPKALKPKSYQRIGAQDKGSQSLRGASSQASKHRLGPAACIFSSWFCLFDTSVHITVLF